MLWSDNLLTTNVSKHLHHSKLALRYSSFFSRNVYTDMYGLMPICFGILRSHHRRSNAEPNVLANNVNKVGVNFVYPPLFVFSYITAG